MGCNNFLTMTQILEFFGRTPLKCNHLPQTDFLLQSPKTTETHWWWPSSSWWPAAGLAGWLQLLNRLPFTPSSLYTGTEVPALKYHAPETFLTGIWRFLYSNICSNIPKTTQPSSFSVPSTDGHYSWRYTAFLVTFTYIHSKVPQGTDLLPLLWESPSCSKTKGRWWQDQGNRRLKQHSRYRCVLSLK